MKHTLTRRDLLASIPVIALGALLFVLSAFIRSSPDSGGLDNDAEILTRFGEDGSTLVLGSVVAGLGFLCFALPLYVLFRASQARNRQARAAFIVFCFIGPVLLAIQAPISALALKDAGEKYLDQVPAVEAEAGRPT